MFAAAHRHSRAPAELIDIPPNFFFWAALVTEFGGALTNPNPPGILLGKSLTGKRTFFGVFWTGPGLQSGAPLHRKMGILTSSATAFDAAAWLDHAIRRCDFDGEPGRAVLEPPASEFGHIPPDPRVPLADQCNRCDNRGRFTSKRVRRTRRRISFTSDSYQSPRLPLIRRPPLGRQTCTRRGAMFPDREV